MSRTRESSPATELSDANPSKGEISQTLDRGLQVLSLLAHRDGLTIAEVSGELKTARAVVYRLVRTLELHRLVERRDNRLFLGIGLAQLAIRFRPRLQDIAQPILRILSRQTNSTALLSVADGDHALVLMTEEPEESTLHLAMRRGARHPLTVGADGVAILAGRPSSSKDSPDVVQARRDGYALSVGALQSGAVGVAAPIRTSDWATASIGVVQVGTEVSDPAILDSVTAAADLITRNLLGE